MTDLYTVRHEEQAQIYDADQVEMSAVIRGTAVVDVGQFDDRVAGVLDDEADSLDGSDPRWQRQDRILEDEVGPVRIELERRQSVLGDAYPFELVGNELVYRPSDNIFYEYFLSVSTSPSLTKKPYTGLPRSFERITAQLVRSYLGVHAEAFHTGAPRNPEVGRTYAAAMQKLHEVAGARDWYWSPMRGFPVAPTRGGDEGLDFVVWKRSLDGRIGELVVIGQCACGNDWDTKFGDLTLERLEPWFRPVTYVQAIRCFATPFVLSDGNFLVAHGRAGWTLDRIRLVKMAEAAGNDAQVLAWLPTMREMLGLVATAA